MALNPWESDRSLSAENVRGALMELFPQLSLGAVTFFSKGWDYDIYEMNGEWLFRFPRQEKMQKHLEVELTALPEIAAHLPLPVPRYEFIGKPTRYFPYIFAGYRKIPGIPLLHAPKGDISPTDLARLLGTFLNAIHAFSVDRAAALGVPMNDYTMEKARDFSLRCIAQADMSKIDGKLKEHCRKFLASRPLPKPAPKEFHRVLHGDFHGNNILWNPDGKCVSAVVDWTDLSIGDVQRDFSWLWIAYGDEFLEELLTHYHQPRDDGIHERIRYRGITITIAAFEWAVVTDERRMLDICIAALKREFGTS